MGAFYTLFNNLREDDGKFFNYFRMSPKPFDELYSKLDHVHKRVTNMRRWAVTLRYVDYSPYIIFKCLSVMLLRPFYMELRSERHSTNKYSPIMSAKSIKQKRNTLLSLSVTLLLDTSMRS
jgi:hypothetical protein